MNDHRRLLKNTTIYALGDIIPRLLAFISLPILAEHLSPDQYGILGYVNSMLMVMMTLGLLSLNTYYLVFYYRQKDDLQRKRLLGNLTLFVLMINAVVAGLMMCFGSSIFGLLGSKIDFYPYLAIGVLTHFTNLFPILPSALYRLQERPLLFTVLNTTKGLLELALMVVMVVCWGYGVLGVLWAKFIVSAIFAVIFMVLTRNEMILCLDWRKIRSALRFSLPLLPGAVAYYLITMSDRLFIDKYLNLSDLGIYNIAATLAMLLNILSVGAYKAFEPHFFKTYGAPDFEAKFAKIRDAFIAVMLFGVLGLSLFAREFFEIMTPASYDRAYFYVPLILVGVYASSVMLLYGTVVVARGKTRTNSLIMICGGVVSVALNIILLPRLGLVAASVASGITFISMLAATIRVSGLRVAHRRVILASLIAAVAICLGVYYLPFDGFAVRLWVKVAIFIAANLAIMLALGLSVAKIRKAIFSK